jgi:hypothetical protein
MDFLRDHFNETDSQQDSLGAGALTPSQFSWIIIGVSVFLVLVIAIIGIFLYKRMNKRKEDMITVISMSEGRNSFPFSDARVKSNISCEDTNVLLRSDSLNQGGDVEERQDDYIEGVRREVQFGEGVYTEDTEVDEII